MEPSRSTSSSSSQYEEYRETVSGEGGQPSFLTSLTNKLWALTIGNQTSSSQIEEKQRKVTGSKTPRDLVEDELFYSAEGSQEEDTVQQSSSRPTIEEKRKNFSGRKTPPVIFGSALNLKQVQGMSESDRSALHLALQNEKERLEGDEDGSPGKPLTPKLTPRAIASQLKTVEMVRISKRDEDFLKRIEQPSNESLQDNVNFFAKGILEIDYLFTLIGKRITEKIAEKSDESIAIAAIHLNFCVEWLNDHRDSPELLKEAQAPLNSLITTVENSNHPFLISQGAALAKVLKAALESKATDRSTVPAGYYGTKSQFRSLLEDIANGTRTDIKTYAKKAAKDLFQMQVQLFCNISENDFASQSTEAITKFCNADNVLVEFILNNIIYESKLNGRKNLMKFYLHLGYYSLKKYENHQTAACIFSAISSTLFDKLPETKRKVHEHMRFFELKKIFDTGDLKFEFYRSYLAACETKQKRYIPYLPLFLNDFVVKEANHPRVVEEPRRDPQFNFKKLEVLKQKARESLKVQERLQDIRKNPEPYLHDFVKVDILSVPPYSEKEKEKQHLDRKRQAESYKEGS